MKDKICIVTGANSGIGKEIAKALASKGAHVVMVCRNEERGKKALNEIKAITGSDNLDLLLADLGSMAQVRKLSETINNKYAHIDVLVNNAGNFFLHKEFSAEGIEKTFAINYLATFYLSNLLLPKLEAAAHSRIIIVSSRNQSMGKIDLEHYHFDNRIYNGLQAYSNAKLMTVIFAREMSKRLEGKKISINAVHPGDVRTNIGMNDNNMLFKLIWRTKCLFNISVEKGAESPLYLAMAPEASGITGKYIVKKKPAKHNPIANQPGIGERLWEFSETIIRQQ